MNDVEMTSKATYGTGPPSPPEIKPHRQVTLHILPGKNCEVENCGRPAYLVCGDQEDFNHPLYPFLIGCCMKKIE